MELASLVTIIQGVPFRSRVESHPEGEISVVQARDLSDDGAVSVGTAARVMALPGSPRARLVAGDVVVQPRGTRYASACFPPTSSSAVAAAPLVVLRPDRSRILPDFLVLFLGLPTTQSHLRKSATGTYVPQVPRQALEALSIPLPDLETQRLLVELAGLMRREKELMERIREGRERVFELALRELDLQPTTTEVI
jgi:hypothetical protein